MATALWNVVQTFLLQDHTTQCSKFPVSCPNSCGGSFPNEMVSLSILPFELTSTDIKYGKHFRQRTIFKVRDF